jgi:outer membrane protein assembly factor BamB
MIKDGGVVTCLDAETGQLQYQSRVGRGHFSSSPIYANGKIYISSREGIVSVLQVGNRLKTLSENDLGESIVATPAIADDTLYVRTNQHLYAFKKMDSK